MMKAGTYYIGDLCYVMHDEWNEVCDLFFAGRNDQGCNDGEFTLADGRKFASYGTLYGDGTYDSNIGTRHSVDAGLIGCILVDDIRDDSYDDIESLGAIVTFDQDFTTGSTDGVIRFGHVKIDTGDDDYDDYYEEEEEY